MGWVALLVLVLATAFSVLSIIVDDSTTRREELERIWHNDHGDFHG